ncbi:MAG: hypothetical protein JSW52_08465 [Candidatus Coatesbacteria bacterium]|nr:MAG: hypothetical protein JSW52_08465 [Candidatus Coatesbacteria bacterium]
MRITTVTAISTVVLFLCGCGAGEVETPPEVARTERVDEGAGGKGIPRENARVVKLSVPFRTRPSEEVPTVEGRPAVFYGTYLDILDVKGDDWLEVRHRSGDVGWIMSRDADNTYAYRSGEHYPNMKSSEEFVGRWREDIYEWAPDARVGLLLGEIANLDGVAVDWAALFFAKSKPGKKLYIDEKGTSELGLEEDLPFDYVGERSDLVPHYTWFPVYTGPPDPISSAEICAPGNIAAFVGSWAVLNNRDVIEKGNATVYLILSETYWLIEFYQSPDSVITGTFNPITGEFLDASGSLRYKGAPAPAY